MIFTPLLTRPDEWTESDVEVYLASLLIGFQGIHPASHWPLIIRGASPIQLAWSNSQQIQLEITNGRPFLKRTSDNAETPTHRCPERGGPFTL